MDENADKLTPQQARLLDVQDARDEADKLLATGAITKEQWQEVQNQLGAIDRGAYAEAKIADNPMHAAGLLGFIPAEHLIRSAGGSRGRSEPTVESIAEGYRGVGRGLRDSLQKAMSSILRTPQRLPERPAYESPPTSPSPRQQNPTPPENLAAMQSRVRALRR